MKWVLEEPKLGDIVRIKLGSIYHFGIYVSDDEIIQFGLPPVNLDRDASQIKVCTTNLNDFLCGKFLEVGIPDKQEKKKINSPKEIVKKAQARIGEGGYHILYNNCEHFVNQCAFNQGVCEQIENVRKMWQGFNLIDVYVKKFPFKVENNKIFPKERQKEINSCTNTDVKNEKFYAWKLLEYALKTSLDKKIKNMHIYQKQSKWVCDECEFSISHSGDLVAVVVAKKPVGIDVEKISERFKTIDSTRILTENELNQNKNIDGDYLNKIWTVKESLFKQQSGECFNPTKIETANKKYITKTIKDGDCQYYITIASDDSLFAKYNLDDNLSIK